MSEFSASLLREKFVLRDTQPATEEAAAPVIALSNRLALPLSRRDFTESERIIVRAQNMHTCARLAAHLARDFHDYGSLFERAKPFDWDDAYESVIKGYEKKWNPNRWIAVYHNGRVVYENGERQRHPFLDIIEQCDAHNPNDYEKAVRMAEDAFKQAGKTVTIAHDSNVALIVSINNEDEGKCGVIVRGPNNTTTFNFTARKRGGRAVRPSQLLGAAAAFLEGIQLAFFIGMTRQKIAYDMITVTSPEALRSDDASQKLGRLNVAVSQFENLLSVKYRPDRPDFGSMIDDAEKFARKSLAAEIERRALSGEEGGWVV